MKVNSPHFRGCKAPPLPALWYSSFLHPHGVALYLSCSAATGQGLYWSGDIVLLQVFKYWSAGKPELATGRRCAHLREVDQQELPKSFTIVFTCPCSSPKKKKKMAKGFSKVLIVGAGPAGLLLALLLAQHDIKVDVVEALVGIDERPRGAGYGPAAVQYASGRVKPPVC